MLFEEEAVAPSPGDAVDVKGMDMDQSMAVRCIAPMAPAALGGRPRPRTSKYCGT